MTCGERVHTPYGSGLIRRTNVRFELALSTRISYDSRAGMSSVSEFDNVRAAPADSSSLTAGVVVSGG